MIETISQPKNPMMTKKSATTISPITLLTDCPIVSDFPAANSAADAAFVARRAALSRATKSSNGSTSSLLMGIRPFSRALRSSRLVVLPGTLMPVSSKTLLILKSESSMTPTAFLSYNLADLEGALICEGSGNMAASSSVNSPRAAFSAACCIVLISEGRGGLRGSKFSGKANDEMEAPGANSAYRSSSPVSVRSRSSRFFLAPSSPFRTCLSFASISSNRLFFFTSFSGSSIHWVSSPVAAPIRTPRKFSSSLDLPEVLRSRTSFSCASKVSIRSLAFSASYFTDNLLASDSAPSFLRSAFNFESSSAPGASPRKLAERPCSARWAASFALELASSPSAMASIEVAWRTLRVAERVLKDEYGGARSDADMKAP
mmetsp:Transcript_59715/g.96716  ORF Transcript_59715/g.96716 Transcript_59715/m.96716 type:complete len:374 (-) Transcript_59715:82-1203(-)